MQARQYTNKRGQLVYVDYWAFYSDLWYILTEPKNCQTQRSKPFPTREPAQLELDARAKKRGWELVIDAAQDAQKRPCAPAGAASGAEVGETVEVDG